ncbi:MAG: sporulation transcription factor Spo0A [Clostridia bacterium]|nr:sporulation transcription factor Spo0A [Clostridia bacterium]
MERKTVFLLQDTKDCLAELKRVIEEDSKYQVVGESTDGISAISMIADIKPDILITELVMSGYDGLSIISKIKEMKLKTKIIVLSALCREEIILKAVNTGADYFMAKPFNATLLKERMEEVCSDEVKQVNGFAPLHSISLEEKISKIFINVGIPPHIKGYSFLREGVKMAVENPLIINNITKGLYPKIGEKYDTSPSKVERAIRHAIEVAWSRGRIENINGILGVRAYVGQEKPTNGEFIALVADKMLLENT